MPKTQPDHHPSVAIIKSVHKGTTYLVFSAYDETYPQLSYRSKPNNLGGNPNRRVHPSDTCPENTLLREILLEEVDPNHPPEVEFGETGIWAAPSKIRFIRNSITANLRPYQDFLFSAKQFANDKTTKTYAAIFSVFHSLLPEEDFECIKECVDRQERVVTEGNMTYRTIDSLLKGPLPIAAHATPHILNDYYGVNIPVNPELQTTALNHEPLRTYEDYLQEFDYAEKIKPFVLGK